MVPVRAGSALVTASKGTNPAGEARTGTRMMPKLDMLVCDEVNGTGEGCFRLVFRFCPHVVQASARSDAAAARAGAGQRVRPRSRC
jgi:hypothetical protein